MSAVLGRLVECLARLHPAVRVLPCSHSASRQTLHFVGAGGGNRTHTGSEPHGILSPARLPVSPLRPGEDPQYRKRQHRNPRSATDGTPDGADQPRVPENRQRTTGPAIFACNFTGFRWAPALPFPGQQGPSPPVRARSRAPTRPVEARPQFTLRSLQTCQAQIF